ncbi:MAG TPA: DUF3754 domain-containing protein [Fimbriiglobus sp.]
MSDGPLDTKTELEHHIPSMAATPEAFFAEDTSDADRNGLRQLADACYGWGHSTVHTELIALKHIYASFDPDQDRNSPFPLSEADIADKLESFFMTFASVLKKANYVRLSREDFERIIKGASYWGVDMDVCFEAFDRLDVYVRGFATGTRTRRIWYKGFKKKEISVPTFDRVVIVLRQSPHVRLGSDADTRNVFIKFFKDIPQMDIEMLLPGTRLKMPLFSRLKLGGSGLGSLGWVGYKLSGFSLGALGGAALSGSLIGLITLAAPLTLIVGYGYRTFSSFQNTRKTYQLQLHQSLYYQNLDNNAGVLFRIADKAEEQEGRELFVGYGTLWKAGPMGLTADELDRAADAHLARQLVRPVDFDTPEILANLLEAKIVEKQGDRYVAVPIDLAIKRLVG